MRRALWAILFVAAAARLMLQASAMPPYAGLDEVYHVARVAFVAQERRQPTIAEPSIAPYLYESMHGVPGAPPAFGELFFKWPELVRRGPIAVDRAISAENQKPYVRPDYEAQQPGPYYAIAGRIVPRPTQLTELRALRLLAVLLALVIVAATAWMASRWNGDAGLVAAVLIVSMPTWQTFVLRSSNDALACAFVALAIAISGRRNVAPALAGGFSPAEAGATLLETALWAGAIATKLYTWPLAIVLPVFWRKQRASWTRIAIVCAGCAIAAILTLSDLSERTRNPIGNFGFDPMSAAHHTPPSIRIWDMAKITIASFIWTSGQHADALRPIGMALYVLPILALALWSAAACRRFSRPKAAASCRTPKRAFLIATLVFFIATLFNASGFIRQARASGIDLPLGGKEGWYWYVLAPLGLATIGATAIRHLGRAKYFLVGWAVLWDILIHEGALFHDWAGATSPGVKSALFTWGPWHPPFTADLGGIGTGPFAGATVTMRIFHLVALAALLVLESKLQGSSSDGTNRDASHTNV